MTVRRLGIAKYFVAVTAIIAAAFMARPAAAQFSLGSPGGPPRLSLGAGAFDITPNAGHHDSHVQGLFNGEYHFGDVLWIISPMFGAQVSTGGSTYVYGGF